MQTDWAGRRIGIDALVLKQAIDVERDFPAIVQKSLRASSMRGNPVELTEREIVRVLEASME